MNLVSYADAEDLCVRLADALHDRLGDDLSTYRFAGIPRGGFVVLGLLSYVLGLDRSQFHCTDVDSTAPLIVVDDCSLSGRRFAQLIDSVSAERIVFAHLFSHPRLRKTILDAEPRVIACLAAADLVDRTDHTPSDPDAFWDRWRMRLSGKRYWYGFVEPIAFAWSEPDRLIWSPEREAVESHWHFASPRSCLDARCDLGLPLSIRASGSIVLPPQVAWKFNGEDVTLWHAESDEVYRLAGVAGSMWRALIGWGSRAHALEYLLTEYEVESTRLRDDLAAFTSTLLEHGLLALDEAQSATLEPDR